MTTCPMPQPTSLSLAIALAFAMPAWAQSTPPAAAAPAASAAASAPAASSSDVTLPTVKVKAVVETATTEGSRSYTTGATNAATGLTLSIRDTPQSVSVITRERIKDQAMTSVADALRGTIGISVKPFDRARSSLSARGFDINNFQLDGAPVANGNIGLETANTALFDRIEIVRGATGLLSGAGDPSASVNMVRKHALSKVLTGSAEVEVGSWHQRTGTVDLTTSLSADGAIRARVVAQAGRRDAFIDREHTDNTLFYGVIDADLGPDTLLSIGASDQRDKRDGVMWASLPYWRPDGSRTNWPRSRSTAATSNEWNTTEQSVFASLSHTLGNRWTVRADAAYNRQKEFSNLLWIYEDPVDSGLLVSYPYRYITEPSQSNLSASVTGPFKLLGREHELHAGVMYSRAKDGWDNSDPIDGTPRPIDLDTWDGSSDWPLGEQYVAARGTVTQSAVYGVTRLQLTDPLKLIVGGRLSHWKREDHVAVWTETATVQEERNVFTPYAGLVFDLSPSLSAYASYSDIFKPQTYRTVGGSTLDPLQGTAWEGGLKGEFFDGKLNASAAVFRVLQENFPVETGIAIPGSTEMAYRSVDGVKVTGYELTLVGELARGWQLDLGWTQFKISRDPNGNEVGVDHPRKQLKLFTKVDVAPLPGLSLGGGINWESAKPVALYTNPGTGEKENTAEGAITLVDAMASYEFDKRWSLQLNVSNLFDKTYRVTSFWGSVFTYGEPRKVVLKASYNF